MSRLSRLALSKRSVTLLFAAALFFAGASAWGSLKQELLPDIDFPVITVVTPYPGAGSSDVTEQVTKPIENAISGVPRLETIQSTSSNSISLVVTQFSFGTDVKATTQPPSPRRSPRPTCPRPPSRRSRRSTSTPRRWSSRRSPRRGSDGLEEVAQIARTEIVPEIVGDRRRRPGRRDRRPRGAGLHHARPGQDGGSDHHQPADRRRPAGQQPHPALRPAARRRLEDPGVDDRRADVGRPDPRPRRRLPAGAARCVPGPGRLRTGRQRRAVVRPERRALRRRRSRRSRSRSATSARSSPTSSRRPATAGPTATRR